MTIVDNTLHLCCQKTPLTRRKYCAASKDVPFDKLSRGSDLCPRGKLAGQYVDRDVGRLGRETSRVHLFVRSEQVQASRDSENPILCCWQVLLLPVNPGDCVERVVFVSKDDN